MHASIWKFAGDPDDLLPRYDALLAQIPTSNFRAHLCLRAPDGMVLVDSCPSREIFEAFAASDDFRMLREQHGLPAPSRIDDYPVHAAILEGSVVSESPVG